jgi:hypothetical protein
LKEDTLPHMFLDNGLITAYISFERHGNGAREHY